VQRAYRKGSFTGYPGRYVKKGSRYDIPPQGPLCVRGEPVIRREACIPGTLNDEGRALGMGRLFMRGTWMEGSFTWNPERNVQALEWASVSIGALLLGNMEGHPFLRDLEIKRYIKRYVKMPCKRVSLSIGALLGNLEGIHLPGLFERKGKYIWV
jgi:hypothetical protein